MDLSELEGCFYPEYICNPELEIARGDWWHIKFTCDHGSFESHVTSYMNITDSLEIAKKAFDEYEHVRPCWKLTKIPDSWQAQWSHEDQQSECELFKGHEGDCFIFEDDESEAERRKIVRFRYPSR